MIACIYHLLDERAALKGLMYGPLLSAEQSWPKRKMLGGGVPTMRELITHKAIGLAT